ncbi:MAG TPA: non-homologous end-joining DNA ligase [Bryobacteraceae bacterium]|jgi:bifunctional non-homologous end joining protein LigD|nr:non-homologous end-joining DNA ligase [Bryobacteraceae bacterium]
MSGGLALRVEPMLATLVKEPFERPGWVYEEKYDGYRILAYKEGHRVTLLSRNAKDRTAHFQTVADAVSRLPRETLVLDGEVVAFDRRGVSRFQLLQNLSTNLHYAVFDCLYVDGRDLRKEPLRSRRAELEKALGKPAGKEPVIFCSSRLAADGLKAYEIAKRKGFEGVLAKDEASSYTGGRSGKWLKFKVKQEDEFLIAGYTAPAGAREHFGALLLAAHSDGELKYVGKVGTGFSQESLAQLYRKFQPLVRSKPQIVDPPRERDITWLAPRLVAQIAYGEWTDDRKLRQPVFLGLRDDKRPQEVVLPVAK